MSFYWILVLVQAAYITFILFTGRIRLKVFKAIDRDAEPGNFWWFVTLSLVVEAVLVGQAIFPRDSN